MYYDVLPGICTKECASGWFSSCYQELWLQLCKCRCLWINIFSIFKRKFGSCCLMLLTCILLSEIVNKDLLAYFSKLYIKTLFAVSFIFLVIFYFHVFNKLNWNSRGPCKTGTGNNENQLGCQQITSISLLQVGQSWCWSSAYGDHSHWFWDVCHHFICHLMTISDLLTVQFIITYILKCFQPIEEGHWNINLIIFKYIFKCP